MLDGKAVKSFIEAYRLDYGIVLSDKEARIKAEELIRFTRVIARTLKKPKEVSSI